MVARAEIPEGILLPLPMDEEDQEVGSQVLNRDPLLDLEVESILLLLPCWSNSFVLEIEVAFGSHNECSLSVSFLSLLIDSCEAEGMEAEEKREWG